MTEPAPRLRLVDQNGELHAAPDLEQLRDELEGVTRSFAAAKGENTRLRRELSAAQGVEPEAKDVMDVLLFWRAQCMPRAQITVGSERWQKTRARLRERDAESGERCYSPLKLKAAVVGAMLSDFHMQNRDKGYLDAASIFGDSRKVDAHIQRAVGFKRLTGISALTLVDELGSEALRWLAERCSCTHLWVEHLRGGPRPGGLQPCSVEGCGCANFDYLSARIDRWVADKRGET